MSERAEKIIILLCIAPAIALWGMTISLIWNWFVVRAFGVGSLSTSEAIGLYSLLAMLKAGSPKEKVSFDGIMGNMFLLPLLSLLIAFIAHLFL